MSMGFVISRRIKNATWGLPGVGPPEVADNSAEGYFTTTAAVAEPPLSELTVTVAPGAVFSFCERT